MLTVADWAPVRLCSNFSRKNTPVQKCLYGINYVTLAAWNNVDLCYKNETSICRLSENGYKFIF